MKMYCTHPYDLCVNITYKSTAINMATVRNYEVVSDKFIIVRICTQVIVLTTNMMMMMMMMMMCM